MPVRHVNAMTRIYYSIISADCIYCTEPVGLIQYCIIALMTLRTKSDARYRAITSGGPQSSSVSYKVLSVCRWRGWYYIKYSVLDNRVSVHCANVLQGILLRHKPRFINEVGETHNDFVDRSTSMYNPLRNWA